jgi:hypothetical protein
MADASTTVMHDYDLADETLDRMEVEKSARGSWGCWPG